MFDKLYVKNADGSITVWTMGISGSPRKTFAQHVPRGVRDAFEYYNCTRITDNGWDIKPDMATVQTDAAPAAPADFAEVAGTFVAAVLRRF